MTVQRTMGSKNSTKNKQTSVKTIKKCLSIDSYSVKTIKKCLTIDSHSVKTIKKGVSIDSLSVKTIKKCILIDSHSVKTIKKGLSIIDSLSVNPLVHEFFFSSFFGTCL